MDSTCNAPVGVSAGQTVEICSHRHRLVRGNVEGSRISRRLQESVPAALLHTNEKCTVDQSLLGQNIALAYPITEQCHQG